jgi:hypothetical protein
MRVDVTIGGTSPNFTVSCAGPPYTAPLSVYFTNTSLDQCKVWYQVAGGSAVLSQLLAHNGSFSESAGVSFNVTAPTASNPSTWAHVIHIG